MNLEFESARFQLAGSKMSNGHEWVDVTVRFRDPVLDCCPRVEITSPVKSDDSRSIADVQREAVQYAVRALREAADLLEKNTPDELIRRDLAQLVA